MKHISEIFNKVRSVFFVMMMSLLLVIFVGSSGCTFGGSSGSSSSDAKEDPVGCTDRDRDGFYVEEGCGKRLDCNDSDLTINPRANEYCVGIDNDCDGLIDEDCLPEICDDGIDNDGDGVIDEACQPGNSFVSDTGQTRCYDTMYFLYPCPSPGEDFYGQDACYATAGSPFTKLDAGGFPLTKDALNWAMVRDNLTGLIWEVKTDDDTLHDKNLVSEWDDAGAVVIAQLNNENFGGYSDWRLPNIKELSSIIYINHRIPAIDTDYFPNTMDYYYWSSLPWVKSNGREVAWVLDFSNGAVNSERRDFSCYVRAVRGQTLSPVLTDNGDGTVTMAFNGGSLMWSQDSTPEKMVWKDGLNYCEDLELAGYSDWRMPNIKELRMLLVYDGNIPPINRSMFPVTYGAYWSSTNIVGSSGEAWVVDFSNGSSTGGNDKTYIWQESHVRAVRGGQ